MKLYSFIIFVNSNDIKFIYNKLKLENIYSCANKILIFNLSTNAAQLLFNGVISINAVPT